MTAMLIVLGTLPIVEAWRDRRGAVRLAGVTASYALVSAVETFPFHPAGAALWFVLASVPLVLVLRARILRAQPGTGDANGMMGSGVPPPSR